MKYFSFIELNQKAEVAEMFLLVAAVYIVILICSWIYTRFVP